jgi:hypothetical protein
MKQTIQIADKPTLDKVKSLLEDSGYGLEALKKLLEEQDSKQIFYKGLEGYESGSTNEYRELVNIEGKGKLYFAACRAQVHASNRCGIRITKNPNSNSSEVIMEKIINNSSANSGMYASVGFYTKDFLPQRGSATDSTPLRTLICNGAAAGTSFTLLDKNNAVTPSEITKPGQDQMLALFNSEPIEFTEGLKLEIYSYGNYGIVYSLDDE